MNDWTKHLLKPISKFVYKTLYSLVNVISLFNRKKNFKSIHPFVSFHDISFIYAETKVFWMDTSLIICILNVQKRVISNEMS